MMMKLDPQQFFRDYLDPHKPDVAEWGAEVGFWGGNRASAEKNIRGLIDAAIAQAGLNPSKRFEQYDELRTQVNGTRGRMFSRLGSACGRLTGSIHRSSRSLLPRMAETLGDLGMIVALPTFLAAHWTVKAVVERRFRQL